MENKELLMTAISHLGSFAIGAGIIYYFQVGDASLALIIGAIFGTQVAAIQYHRRIPDPAPAKVKATAGIVLAVMAIFAGVISQFMLEWMPLPEVTLPIAAIGSFIFPFVLFNSMQKVNGKKDS